MRWAVLRCDSTQRTCWTYVSEAGWGWEERGQGGYEDWLGLEAEFDLAPAPALCEVRSGEYILNR